MGVALFTEFGDHYYSFVEFIFFLNSNLTHTFTEKKSEHNENWKNTYTKFLYQA